MTSAKEDDVVAAELARKITEAMMVLPPGLALVARAHGKQVEIALEVFDEFGGLEDRKEWRLGEELAAMAAAPPECFDAFLAASARWLGAQPIARRTDLWPDDIFVSAVLSDARLRSFEDFDSALGDPARRGLYAAKAELGDLFERHGLGSDANEEALRAVYALTRAGRTSYGLPESIRAVRWLASHASGQRMLVAMMHEWANEPYDPFDVAWRGGPLLNHLLLTGAFCALDPTLTNGDDELRRKAICAFDRLPEPAAPSDLSRAGF
jgi:hypothetical protein